MKWRCPSCKTENNTLSSKSQSLLPRDSYAPLPRTCRGCGKKYKLGKKVGQEKLRQIAGEYQGELLLWIDQTNDETVHKDMVGDSILKSLAFQVLGASVLSGGLCAAITIEWISANMFGGSELFRDENLLKIPERYIQIQHDYLNKVDQYKKVENPKAQKTMGLLLEQHKEIVSSFENGLISESEALTKGGLLLKRVDKITKDLSVLEMQIYDLSGMISQMIRPRKVGMGIATKSGNNFANVLVQYIQSHQGYYAVHMKPETGNESHVIGIECHEKDGDVVWRLLDANTGEWRFDSHFMFLFFLGAYFDLLYGEEFSGGKFTLIAYDRVRL